MNLPRVIILAAGQGSRLGPLFGDLPKPLAPFGSESLLQRNLRQLQEAGFTDITVVVGYKAELMESVIRLKHPEVRLVHNPRYAEDKNILSLLLGLNESLEPVLLVEGDVAFSDLSFLRLRFATRQGASFWSANGAFNPDQMGVILKPDEDDHLVDIRYETYDRKYQAYLKNLGGMYIGAREMPTFHRLLKQRASAGFDVCFFTVWIDHQQQLPARVFDLGRLGGASFNTPEEYRRTLRLVLQQNDL